MKKIIQLLSLATLATSLIGLAPLAYANSAPTKSKSTSNVSKAATTAPEATEEDEEPDVRLSKSFDYKCELGNSLTMYTNSNDNQHIAMRWKKRLYRMTRIDTTTGANRFENRKAGFIFIGIPSKGLLLDSHRGHQLANECKTTDPELAAEAHGVSVSSAVK
jgi:hypothetical protein